MYHQRGMTCISCNFLTDIGYFYRKICLFSVDIVEIFTHQERKCHRWRAGEGRLCPLSGQNLYITVWSRHRCIDPLPFCFHSSTLSQPRERRSGCRSFSAACASSAAFCGEAVETPDGVPFLVVLRAHSMRGLCQTSPLFFVDKAAAKKIL